MIFTSLLRHTFCMVWESSFSIFSYFFEFLFFREPSPRRIPLHESYGFRTSTFFRKLKFPRNVTSETIKFRVDFKTIFTYFLIIFMTCSASILVSICSLNLNGKRLPKWTKKHSKKLGFFHVKTSFRAPVTPVSPRDVISSPKGTPK